LVLHHGRGTDKRGWGTALVNLIVRFAELARATGTDIEAANELLRKGERLLKRRRCKEALEALEQAEVLGLQDTVTGEWEGRLAWRLHQARHCVGAHTLALGDRSALCEKEITFLGDADLKDDFVTLADTGSDGGPANARHLPKWHKLFGVTEESCDPKVLKRAYRKLMLKYHPDKYKGEAECAQTASLWLNAGNFLVLERCAEAKEEL
jgi:DnaJ-domain-containing protein 1